MQLRNFEQGILRLYYVAWVLLFFTTAVVNWMQIQHDFHYGHLDAEEIVEAAMGVTAALIGPGIAMWMIRWVYRGFVPKP